MFIVTNKISWAWLTNAPMPQIPLCVFGCVVKAKYVVFANVELNWGRLLPPPPPPSSSLLLTLLGMRVRSNRFLNDVSMSVSILTTARLQPVTEYKASRELFLIKCWRSFETVCPSQQSTSFNKMEPMLKLFARAFSSMFLNSSHFYLRAGQSHYK